MIDHTTVKLGCNPSPPDSRDLLLTDYVADAGRILDSPAIPAALDWAAMPRPDGIVPVYDTDPLGNVELGDCVFAAAGHLARRVGQLVGDAALAGITAEMVKREYLDATNGQDVGYSIRGMLERWRTRGLFGFRIDAHAAVEWRDPVQRQIAVAIGCGTIDGYALPLCSQGQTDELGRQLWDVPLGGWPEGKGPATWGNHCIWQHAEGGYLSTGDSWGERTTQTQAWKWGCCFESRIVLLPQWGMSGRAPNGFAYADMLSDARAR
jgi:hypothetical protein